MFHSARLLVLPALLVAALAVTATTGARTGAPGPLRVTIDIVAAGHDEVASPANLAVRSGGTTTLVIRNHTSLFHTFTVRALGLSVLVRPARAGGVRTTSVTFVAPHGVYVWRCVLCASSSHPEMHAMRGKVYAIVNT